MDFEKVLPALKENARYIECPQRWGYCSGVIDCAKAFLLELSKEHAISDKSLHSVFKQIKDFRNGL